MENNLLKTPVLFLTFNRLDTTKRVFEVIKEVRPEKLYIASDGPRKNVSGEDLKVNRVRDFIKSNINWECEVKTLFRDENLGCKVAISSAIDWFFENVEEGIILEDDCLPDNSFFQFCEELLEKYKYTEEVAIISGDNFNQKKIGQADYYYSKIPNIWGWATWRRAWDKYDLNMTFYPEFKNNKIIKNVWLNKDVQKYWLCIFEDAFKGLINTWDYQLTFSLFLNNSLCICPNKNLVSNIGFGKDFTNTVISDIRVTNLYADKIIFPLVHPDNIVYNQSNDDFINKIYLKNYKLKKFLKYIKIFGFIKKLYVYTLSYLRK